MLDKLLTYVAVGLVWTPIGIALRPYFAASHWAMAFALPFMFIVGLIILTERKR